MASLSDSSGRVNVVVIGGGIGGLAAAAQLVRHGLACRVLESQDRVGGRLLSHASAAGRFDLGATWYWPGETRVAALVENLQVATHLQHRSGDAMYHAAGGGRRMEGNPIDVASGRFSYGASSLAEGLANRLGGDVSLGTRVHRIEQSGTDFTVSHSAGTVSAPHVILALPPSLAVQTIEFKPAMPDDVRALAAATPVWMGTVAKAVIVYAAAFWRHQGLAGAAISHIGPLRELHDMSGPDGVPAALFGFAPLAPGEPTPSERDIVDQLVDIFGPDAATPLEVVVKDWRHDINTVPPLPVTGSPMETYGHPRFQQPFADGRIHWASTETALSAPGHIEGGLAAAERAVRAIIIQAASSSAATAQLHRGDTR